MSTPEEVEDSKPTEVYCSELQALLLRVERNCHALIELSRAEREAVVSNEIEELERVTRDKARLIADTDSLERERKELSAALARRLQMPEGSTLSALACKTGEPHAAALLETRQRVVHSVHQLRASNDSNLRLMRKSLDLVRDSMQQLQKRMGRGQPYTSHGRPALRPGGIDGSMMIDCRA